MDLAAALFQRSIRENPRAPGAYVHLGEIALLRGDYAEAMRRFDEAHEILTTLWSQCEIACIYHALGDKDEAFGALEAAVARRETQTIWMATEPRLQPIRADPRFGDLLGKLGLPRPH